MRAQACTGSIGPVAIVGQAHPLPEGNPRVIFGATIDGVKGSWRQKKETPRPNLQEDILSLPPNQYGVKKIPSNYCPSKTTEDKTLILVQLPHDQLTPPRITPEQKKDIVQIHGEVAPC